MTVSLPVLIEPLTPEDCDLRAYPTMPLDVRRLRDSGMASHDDPEAFRAALLLWCASWHQVPAASLPNDDRELAKLAGFGRELSRWRDMKEAAMHGFVLCSDGRNYHRVVAEFALISWEKRKKFVARSQAGVKARLSSTSSRPKRDKVKGNEVKGREGKKKGTAPSGAGRATPPAALPPAKATRLSPSWFADQQDRDYAAGKGLDETEINSQEDAFRDYWWARAGEIARKLDWHATWRTWVRRYLEDRDGRKPRAGGGGRVNGPSRVGNVLHGIVEARRARGRQPPGD